MKKFFNLFFGLLRMIISCIFNFGKLKLHGIKYHLGKGSKLQTEKKGRIILGKKVWIDRNSLFCASNGKIVIGNNNFFNTNNRVTAYGSINIGDNNLFGPNLVIVDHNHKYSEKDIPINRQGFEIKDVTIGSNVWIGANVTVCAGVTICDNVVVGANSVVTKDIVKSGVYAGAPLKFIKDI